MKKEIIINPTSGVKILALLLTLFVFGILSFLIENPILGAVFMFVVLFSAPGFFILNPNESVVLVFFGKYKGSVKENGFFWTNPLMIKKKISLRAQNFDSAAIKVNDKIGNPILIGGVLVWKVNDTYKASFEVNDYKNFITVQSESAIRKLAGLYPYDNLDHEHEISLRSGGEEVHAQLEKELAERLEIAGISVLEARISSLAYASEIAGAMLQRQQAIAMVAARQKIVEGAVGMVESALSSLSDKNIVDLDADKKAAMVSNLMVVLCSDKSASPVINTGTLHQ